MERISTEMGGTIRETDEDIGMEDSDIHEMDEEYASGDESTSMECGASQMRIMELEACYAALELENMELKSELAMLDNEKDMMKTRYELLKRRYDALMTRKVGDEGERVRSEDIGEGFMTGMTVVSDVMGLLSKHRMLRSEFTCPM